MTSLASTLQSKKVDIVRSLDILLPLIRESLEGDQKSILSSSSTSTPPQKLAQAYREAYLLCNAKTIDLTTNNNNFIVRQKQQQQQDSSSSSLSDDEKEKRFYFFPEFISKVFPQGESTRACGGAGSLLLQHMLSAELVTCFDQTFCQPLSLSFNQQQNNKSNNSNNNSNELGRLSALLEMYNKRFESLVHVTLPLLESFLPPSGWYANEDSLASSSSHQAYMSSNNNSHHHQQHGRRDNNNNRNNIAEGSITTNSNNLIHHLFNSSNNNDNSNSSSPPVTLREVIYRHWCDVALTPNAHQLLEAASKLLFLAAATNSSSNNNNENIIIKLVSRFVLNLKEISGCELNSPNPLTQKMFLLDNNNNNSSCNNNIRTYYDGFKSIAGHSLKESTSQWIENWSVEFQKQVNIFNNNKSGDDVDNNSTTTTAATNATTTSLIALMIKDLNQEVNDRALRRHFSVLRDKSKLIEFKREVIGMMDKHCSKMIAPFYAEREFLHINNNSNNSAILTKNLFDLALISTQLMKHLHVNLTNTAHSSASLVLHRTVRKLALLMMNNPNNTHTNNSNSNGGSNPPPPAEQQQNSSSQSSIILTQHETVKRIGIDLVRDLSCCIVDLEMICAQHAPTDGSSLLAIDCGFSNALLSMNFDSSSTTNNNSVVPTTTTNLNPLAEESEADEIAEQQREAARLRNQHLIASLLAVVATELLIIDTNDNNDDGKTATTNDASIVIDKLGSCFSNRISLTTMKKNTEDDQSNNNNNNSRSSNNSFTFACKALALVYRYLPDKDIFVAELSSCLSMLHSSSSPSSSTSMMMFTKMRTLLQYIGDSDVFSSRDLKHRLDLLEQSVKSTLKLANQYEDAHHHHEQQLKADASASPSSVSSVSCSIFDQQRGFFTFQFLPHHLALNFPKTYQDFWSSSSISIPIPIRSIEEEYFSSSSKIYKSLHPNWKLKWCYEVSKCHLEATYDNSSTDKNDKDNKTSITIVCTGLQAAILQHLSSQKNGTSVFSSATTTTAATSSSSGMMISINEAYLRDLAPLERAGLIENVVFAPSSQGLKVQLVMGKKPAMNNNKNKIIDTFTDSQKVNQSMSMMSLMNCSSSSCIGGGLSSSLSSSSTTNKQVGKGDSFSTNNSDNNNNANVMMMNIHPSLIQSRQLSLQAAIMQVLKKEYGSSSSISSSKHQHQQRQNANNQNTNTNRNNRGITFDEIVTRLQQEQQQQQQLQQQQHHPHEDMVMSNNSNNSNSNNNKKTKMNIAGSSSSRSTFSLGFTPTLNDIRTQLESLIQKSYVGKKVKIDDQDEEDNEDDETRNTGDSSSRSTTTINHHQQQQIFRYHYEA